MFQFLFGTLLRRILFTISANLAIIAGLLGFFIVNQTEQALILEFGELKRTIQKPGPYWRIPFIQQVLTYEKRVLNCDISEIELTLGDQKRIIVSVFARYFIKDPELFYKTVGNEKGAEQRLDVIMNGDLRNILGQYSLQDLLSDKRVEFENRLIEQVRGSMLSMGMDLMEIKLKEILFPNNNRQAVFDRMKSERLREAQEWRGKAIKSSSEIKSKADIVAAEIIAKANKDKTKIVGAAEAEAVAIKSNAYNKNPEFGTFYNFTNAYKKSSCTAITLRTDHPFLQYLAK